MDSDDSDFYGGPETVSELQTRVHNFDVAAWARQQRTKPAIPRRRSHLAPGDAPHLHNPYAGVPYAWQLTETVDGFLARLPPRTTTQSLELPWIYICNPWIPRVGRAGTHFQAAKGNEDEAPQEEGSQLQVFLTGGMERLELVTGFMENANKTGRAVATVERDVKKESMQAAQDILDLAHAAKIRPGKWMLFIPPIEVNEVWAIVAKATANNELGIAAKVAPRPEGEDRRQDRLICIYTADFRDLEDVGRVVQKLRELKLVEARGRPIYYKPDAYTYLGIARGNSWGVKASLYSSSDNLGK